MLLLCNDFNGHSNIFDDKDDKKIKYETYRERSCQRKYLYPSISLSFFIVVICLCPRDNGRRDESRSVLLVIRHYCYANEAGRLFIFVWKAHSRIITC